MIKRRLPDLILMLVLFLLPLGMFWQQTLGGRTLIPTENLYQYAPFNVYREVVSAPAVPHNHLLSDLVLQNFQWKSFTLQQLELGEIPLWNPHQFGGIPFLAAGQHSMLYPFSLLYVVLDLPVAYGWFTVLNLWLAGLFMLAFVRSLGLGRGAGLLAGIVYQLGGFILSSVVFQMMVGGYAWLPLMLWMIERLVRRQSPSVSLIVGAGALGMNILAGHAEITLYSLLIAGYYGGLRSIWQAWQERVQVALWRGVLERGALLVALVALGFGLGAVQFIPLLEFAASNWRAERSSLATVLSYAHPPRDLLQFLLPNVYGNPAHHGFMDVFTGAWVDLTQAGHPQVHTEWGIKNYVEGALYLGILPLILAGVALWDSLRQRATHLPPYRALFGILGGLSLSFMFGLPSYALLYALPTINQLNSPFRWIFGLTLCVAVLAAYGMEALSRVENQRMARRLGAGVLALGGILAAGLLVSRLLYGQVGGIVERLYTSLLGAKNAFATAELFYSYQFWNGLILVGVLCASGVVLLWAGRVHDERSRWGGVRLWQVGAGVLVALDLMIASWGFNPASDPALLDFTPPAIQFLQNNSRTDEGVWRFTTLDDPSQAPILNANLTWRYGLYDLRGYDSIIPAPSVALLRQLAPQVQLDFNRIAPLYTVYPESVDAPSTRDLLESDLLAQLSVRYVVTHRSTLIESALYRQVHEDEAVRIWEYSQALPREMFLPDVENRFVPRPLVPSRDTGRERFYDIDTPLSGQLIVHEFYAAGWRAFVRPLGAGEDAEQPLTVEQTELGFMSLRLPDGAWTVRLVYSPTSFQVGLFGTALSGALLVLMMGMAVWRALVGVESAQASTTSRVARNSVAPIILNLFNRGIDFAFLLVTLRILSPQEVGIYYYLVVVFVWFDIFTNFGLDLYVIREISRDRSQAWRLFYNTSVLRVVLSVVGIGLLLAFIFVRQSTVTPALDSTALITIGLLYAGLFPASLSKGMTSLYYAHEQAEKPAAIATITTLNKALFGVIVLVLGWGIIGLALVSIANNFLTLGVLLFNGRGFLRVRDSWRVDMGLIRRMMGHSWALLLNHFLATIFFQVDVILLEALRGAVVVAQYSVAYRWILAINIIPSFFTQALLPVMSRQAHEDKQALWQTYRFGIKLMFALAVPTAIAFNIMAVTLTRFMGGEQYLPDGAIAIQLMLWSIPIGWMNSLTQYALVALDMHKRITRAFFAAVGFNIVTNALFIPQYGYQAAAVTTILSELVLFLPFAYLMRQGLARPVGWLDLLWRPLVAGGAMLMVALIIQQAFIALLLGGIVYLLMFAALRPLEAHEIAQLRKLLRRG